MELMLAERLETERDGLVLETLAAEDIDPFFAFIDEHRDDPNPFGKAGLNTFVTRDNVWEHVAFPRRNKRVYAVRHHTQLVGFAIATLTKYWDVEIGYWTAAPFRERGYGFITAKTLVEEIISIGHPGVIALTDTGNKDSKNLLRSLGFQHCPDAKRHERGKTAFFIRPFVTSQLKENEDRS